MKNRRNILLILTYDGTGYAGWQRQKEHPSIQQTLETGLTKVLQEKITVTGSGRTDSGVHAFAHPASFYTVSQIRTENLVRALNSVLPSDIRVTSAEERPEEFSARFSAKKKLYRYHISTDQVKSPFRDRYSVHYPFPLDLRLMSKALNCLKGEHDFTSFSSVKDESGSRVRRIERISVKKRDGQVTIDFLGSGFLYNMIRIIIGTALEINKDRLPYTRMREILESRDRNEAGPTALSKGLFLVKVFYT
jgi:tRNA pseudouridine38-40 synthase